MGIKRAKQSYETALLKLYAKYGLDRYNFDLFTEYVDYTQKIIRICNTCNTVSTPTLASLFSTTRENNCRVCAMKSTGDSKIKSYEDMMKDVPDHNLIINLPLPPNLKQSENYILFNCKLHGVSSRTLKKILQPSIMHPCSGCGRKASADSKVIHNISDRSGFLKIATNLHEDSYDYSRVVFKDLYTEVDILCKIHGVFNQTPYSHLVREQGCRLCKPCVYTRSGYIEHAKQKNNGAAYLYCFKIEEDVFKIGITTNVKQRIRSIKSESGFRNVTVVALFEGEAGFIYDLETQLHRVFKNYSTEPSKYFTGYTECFSNIDGILNHIPFDQVEVITNNLKEVKYENDKAACAA